MGRDPTPRPGGAADDPATPAAGRRRSDEGNGSGATPVAKRPRDVPRATGTAGPVMTPDDLNAFVYAMHYQVEAMTGWAQTVNEAITDHAVRIDIQYGEGAALMAMTTDALSKAAQGEHDQHRDDDNQDHQRHDRNPARHLEKHATRSVMHGNCEIDPTRAHQCTLHWRSRRG